MERVRVRPLRDVDENVVAGLRALIPQISSSAPPLDDHRLRGVIADGSTTIFIAELGARIVGTASLVALKTLSEQKGQVEDVVVDQAVRRGRIGTSLMQAIIDHASNTGLDHIDLTSRPSRVAANAFYQSLGFERRETNVYRYIMHART